MIKNTDEAKHADSENSRIPSEEPQNLEHLKHEGGNQRKEDFASLENTAFPLADQRWQKAAAISTVLTLITSTLIGGYGVFLGSSALEMSARFESLKLRPMFEYQYSSWIERGAKVSAMNLGYGPAVIKGVSAYYENMAGETVWLKYGIGSDGLRNHDDINMWTFLGMADVNHGTDARLTALWPWIDAVYGPGEMFDFLTVPPIDTMSAAWRERYESTVRQVIPTLRICFTYESLDGILVPYSSNDRCASGPSHGEIVYLGGNDFMALGQEHLDVVLSEVGYQRVIVIEAIELKEDDEN